MAKNPVFHARTKHIELDYHFVREKVVMGDLCVKYVPSHLQIANVLTKPLARRDFSIFRCKLGVLLYLSQHLEGKKKKRFSRLGRQV